MDYTPINQLKLEYNNEVIKIKQYILQAKTQTINKLVKKVKAFKSRKGTEEQQEKHKRKAESFVSEIMILKKIQRNDLAKFALNNIEQLDKFINSPVASKERAMARLISHKSVKGRFIDIKKKYSNIPTARLLERDPKKIRRKLRKEKLKAKIKSTNAKVEAVETQTDSDIKDVKADNKIEDVVTNKKNKQNQKEAKSTANFSVQSADSEIEEETELNDPSQLNDPNEMTDSSEESSTENASSLSEEEYNSSPLEEEQVTEVLPLKRKQASNPKKLSKLDVRPNKKMTIDSDELPSHSTEKIVDSFFVTNGGSNYLSLALPRPADILEDGKDSGRNRKMRRATLFGNKIKFNNDRPRNQKAYREIAHEEKSRNENKKFNKNCTQQNFMRNENKFSSKTEERLHPSWQAKKQQSSILPFKGNKICFE